MTLQSTANPARALIAAEGGSARIGGTPGVALGCVLVVQFWGWVMLQAQVNLHLNLSVETPMMWE